MGTRKNLKRTFSLAVVLVMLSLIAVSGNVTGQSHWNQRSGRIWTHMEAMLPASFEEYFKFSEKNSKEEKSRR